MAGRLGRALQTTPTLAKDFLNGLWNRFSQPERKEWCAIFYFVGQGDGSTSEASAPRDLDTKIEEKIKALKVASLIHPDKVHIVYRAVWGVKGKPVAQVVNSSGWPPAVIGFPGYEPNLGRVDTTKDLPFFLQWAYKWCPAEHYALFFFGHSFGPAGLFAPEAGIVFNTPKPLDLVSLRRALELFNAERAGSQPPGRLPIEDTDRPHWGSGKPGPDGFPLVQSAEASLDLASTKLDVVLFEDCWMSTLETAYELQYEVRYVVASQSLLPLGSDDKNFLWPYSCLVHTLATVTVDWQGQLATLIRAFYQGNPSTFHPKKSAANAKRAPLRTVPITLLDLAAVQGITVPLRAFVSAMSSQFPAKPDRGEKIRLGRIFVDTSDWLAGDAALIDLVALCLEMEKEKDPLATTALALRNALSILIKSIDESLPISPKKGAAAAKMPKLGFLGVSVLYCPPEEPKDTPSPIVEILNDGFYESLKFPKEVGDSLHKNEVWPALEQHQ